VPDPDTFEQAPSLAEVPTPVGSPDLYTVMLGTPVQCAAANKSPTGVGLTVRIVSAN
jgi:hypothetical protein